MTGLSAKDSRWGHRERMRERLLAHGHEALATYELLEMLLYHGVPYRDTKPIAKRLLEAFGCLDGVLRAPAEDLEQIDGVGSSCAERISDFGRLTLHSGSESAEDERLVLNEYNACGRFLADYLSSRQDVNGVVLFLDSSMRLLELAHLPGEDFGSASVKPGYVIDIALRVKASAVAVGFTHRRPLHLPTVSDMATATLLKTELEKLSVTVVEQFMVYHDTYIGIESLNGRGDSSARESHSRFWDTAAKDAARGEGAEDAPRLSHKMPLGYIPDGDGSWELLLPVLKRLGVNEELLPTISTALALKGQSLKQWVVFGAVDDMPPRVAARVRALGLLLTGLASRRYTELFRLGRRHSDEEIADYLIACYRGVREERFYVICKDEHGRVTKVEPVTSGDLMSVSVTPRSVLEIGLRNKARALSVAHNHPGGVAVMSEDDRKFTEALSGALLATGVDLLSHFIVADTDVLEAVCDRDGAIVELRQLRPV